ncbi:MAG: hypothetical protein AABY22_18925 [Nanoarchaeota archaeon]
MKQKKCNHNWIPLRQESSHEGACYHVGSCLIQKFYCNKCASICPEIETIINTTGTSE